MSKSMGVLGEPGQILTYTCHPGFVFVDDPVPASQTALTSTTTTTTTTTTTPRVLSWQSFKGAEYAKVLESNDISWSEGRAICQSAGGDLAKITDYGIQRFLNNLGSLDKTFWIGATDTAEVGTWLWQDGSSVVYSNWNECSCSDCESKNCAAVRNNEEGRWTRYDCSDLKNGVICEKGTSTSQLFNTVFRSGEFAYIMNKKCVTTWQTGKDECTALGADMATYSDTDIRLKVREFFKDENSMMNEDYWIGLNDIDSEGSLVWDNGESYSYSNWNYWARNANNKDCAEVQRSDGQWDFVDCTSENNGVMCMKGRYEPPPPVPAEISNRVTGKAFDSSRCARRVSSGLSGETLQTCCNRCMGLFIAGSIDEFDGITVSDSGDYCQCASRRKTYCRPDWYPYWGWGYDSADCCQLGTTDCAPSKRKKRSPEQLEEKIEITFINKTLPYTKKRSELIAHENTSRKETSTMKLEQQPQISTESVDNGIRFKREIDTLKTRNIECVSLWDGVQGYWKYDFEVPKYCHSKTKITYIDEI